MNACVVPPVAVVVPRLLVLLFFFSKSCGGEIAGVPSSLLPASSPLLFNPSHRRTYEGEWLCDRPGIKETNQG